MAKKQEAELNIPQLPYKNWVIIGIDLSLSRTGYAVLRLEGGVAHWGQVGSIKPKDTSDETWARGTAIATVLRQRIEALAVEVSHHNEDHPDDLTGIILAVEFPDPENSYLMALNGIVQAVLWSSGELGAIQQDVPLYRLSINAMTLRATLRLNTTVQGDKDVNLAMAYEYIDRKTYPNLDSDSCDAVLLAMMGRHAGMVLSGHRDLVPNKPLVTLCSTEMKVKVLKRKDKEPTRKETPRALLHNPATWTRLAGPVQVGLTQIDAKLVLHRHPSSTILL